MSVKYKKIAWLVRARGSRDRFVTFRYGRFRRPILGEGRSSLQPRRKIPNEGFHRRMPKSVKAEEIHLIHGLLCRPAFVCHAIGRDKNTGAIVAESAMHKNLFFRIVVKQR